MSDSTQVKPSFDAVSAPVIQTGSTARNEFQPSPLDPSWIIEGNPTPRALTLAEAADGLFSCGLWDCTAGKFKYTYFCDETVHILEGDVVVQEPGREYTLRAGDVAFFPKGLTAYWTVPHYVKKFCVHRCVQVGALGRIRSKAKKVLQAVFRKK